MKKQFLALALILLLVLVVGCIKPAEMPQEAGEAPAETAISGEVDNVGTLSDELSTSDLDSLDKDLAEVTW